MTPDSHDQLPRKKPRRVAPSYGVAPCVQSSFGRCGCPVVSLGVIVSSGAMAPAEGSPASATRSNDRAAVSPRGRGLRRRRCGVERQPAAERKHAADTLPDHGIVARPELV